jgi:hypothetical protein
MFSRNLFRGIFYKTTRKPVKKHSDCRDVYRFYEENANHGDVKYLLDLYVWSMKTHIITFCVYGYAFYYFVWRPYKLREKFEIKYLTQQPPKEYEADDYDYKYWELIQTKPTETSQILNTDQACKDAYVILYHGQTTSSHIAMQRFARLQRYISLRKDIPIKSVFIGMDREIDPELLQDYCDQYSKDLTVCYPATEEVRIGLEKVFSNIGCIYVLEKGSGNVIYIIDPNKHPLETIATRLIYNISKNMDFRVSREIIEKNINIKAGHDEELRQKLPTY